MRFILATVFGLLATANASYVLKRQFPTCADSCLEDAETGSCPSGDDSCLCNSSAFVDSVTACIESSCSGSELTTAEYDAQQLCLAVGVTLTASSAAASSTGNSTTASSTTASASSASTTQTSGAITHGVNAFAGLAAVGVIAFAL